MLGRIVENKSKKKKCDMYDSKGRACLIILKM